MSSCPQLTVRLTSAKCHARPWSKAFFQPQVSKFKFWFDFSSGASEACKAQFSHVRHLGARLLLPHFFQDFRRLAATATYQSGRVSCVNDHPSRRHIQDQCRYSRRFKRLKPSGGFSSAYWLAAINKSETTVDPLLTHCWPCSLGGRLVVPRSSKAHLAVGHVNASPLQKPMKVALGWSLKHLQLFRSDSHFANSTDCIRILECKYTLDLVHVVHVVHLGLHFSAFGRLLQQWGSMLPVATGTGILEECLAMEQV